MINNSSHTRDYDYYGFDDDYDYDQGHRNNFFMMFEVSRFTISFLTILFNSILIYCFCQEKRFYRRTATKSLLFSLAVCDLITGLSVCIQALCHYWIQILRVEVVITIDSFRLFLTKVYVMHLCGLILDRYVALFFALRYKAIVTKNRKLLYMVITWTIPFVFSSVRVLWLISFNIQIELWYSMVGFIIFLAMPMTLLAIAFLRMFFEVRRIKRRHPDGFVPTPSVSKKFRLISTFSFMYFTFLIVAMPYFLIRFWINIKAIEEESFMLDKSTLQFILVMKDMTSIFNPICYTLINPDVRKAISKNLSPFACAYKLRRNRFLTTEPECSPIQHQIIDNTSFMETCL